MLFPSGNELRYVTITFLLILCIPVIAVIALTQAGISLVSNALVKVNSTNNTIQLYYPNGSPYKTLQVSPVLPVQGVITLEFGESNLPYQPFHTGIDIAGQVGDTIVAILPGKILYAGEISWGYGRHVIIDHGDNITSIYAHLDQILAKEGQTVDQGQVIGTEGQTGWATGPHLHFQINVWGIPVNPGVFTP